MRRAARTASALAAAVLACACGGEPAAEHPPSILLISVDTLRPDHLGSYGYRRDTSPNLDALARRGTVFDAAIAPAPWTLPTHASLLTGRYPAGHGLQEEGSRLSGSTPTLAEGLRARGYHTLAVVSHVYVSSEFGLDRGFDVFDDSLLAGGTRNPVAEEVATRLLARMEEREPGPFFAFVHFFDPHWNYTPPPPFDTRYTDPAYRGPIDGTLASLAPWLAPGSRMPRADRRQLLALYDGEIAYLDSWLGRMLAALRERGDLDDTVVVFTADHGEEFGEHGQLGHAKTLYEEQLRVPLVVAGHDAFAPGTRRGELVSTVDVPATLLAIAGAEATDAAPGRNLLAADAPALSEALVFAETLRFGIELRAARGPRYKALHNRTRDERLYFDLREDPAERQPLAADPSGGRLDAALAAYAAAADVGWHVKLVASHGSLTARGVIATTGEIREVQRRFWNQGRYPGEPMAHFERFDLSADGRTLRFAVNASDLRGELWFETDPPDAPVSFEIALESEDEAGIFLGNGERVAAGQLLVLAPDDARLRAAPRDGPPERGVHLVSLPPAAEPGPPLPAATRAHLRALGYAEPGEPDPTPGETNPEPGETDPTPTDPAR